jgi:hypothetical protein
MEFNFEVKTLGDLLLELFDHRIIELHNFTASPAKKMIVMFLLLGGFIKGVATCFEALLNNTRLEKNWNIPVNRIARNSKTLFFETTDKIVHIKMTALTAHPREEPQPLPGQTQPFSSYEFRKISLGVFHKNPYPD